MPLFPVFIIFFISSVAETNRAPFDLAEAESELVSGFMTEHAAIIFIFFFLAEYASIVLICVLTTILFLGGYLYDYLPIYLFTLIQYFSFDLYLNYLDNREILFLDPILEGFIYVLCSVIIDYIFIILVWMEIFIYYIIIMLLSLLLLVPLIGIFIISTSISYDITSINTKHIKITALSTSLINFFISLVIFILFDFSTNQFQFVQEYYQINYYDYYLVVDGLSIYFILLTTIIMSIALLSY